MKPSTENLDKAVAEAGKSIAMGYTNESLAKLDQALAELTCCLPAAPTPKAGRERCDQACCRCHLPASPKGEVSSLTVTPEAKPPIRWAMPSMPTMISRSWAKLFRRHGQRDAFRRPVHARLRFLRSLLCGEGFTVTLKSNPNVRETYTVCGYPLRPKVVPATAPDGAGNGGLLSILIRARAIRPTVRMATRSLVCWAIPVAVTAVGLAVVVLGVAGGSRLLCVVSAPDRD